MPFLGFSPWFQKLVTDDRIECYGWPIGIATYWFREVASGRPGLITRIGIDTFLDPRREGGALNKMGSDNMFCRISVIDIGEDGISSLSSSKTRLCTHKGYHCRRKWEFVHGG